MEQRILAGGLEMRMTQRESPRTLYDGRVLLPNGEENPSYGQPFVVPGSAVGNPVYVLSKIRIGFTETPPPPRKLNTEGAASVKQSVPSKPKRKYQKRR